MAALTRIQALYEEASPAAGSGSSEVVPALLGWRGECCWVPLFLSRWETCSSASRLSCQGAFFVRNARNGAMTPVLIVC